MNGVIASAPAIGVAVVVALLGFAQGGFFAGAWVWSTVLLAWIGIASLLLNRLIRLDRLELAWIGFVCLVATWTLLSTAWSASPTQSVLEARRDLVYVVGAAAVVLAARRSTVPYLIVGLWAAVSVVVITGLGRYLVERPGHVEGFEGALLFRPLGYANGLGVFSGMGILLAGGVATRSGTPALQAAAAGSFVPLAAALKLTESRGAWLAVAVGAVVGLALERRRGDVVAALAPAAVATGVAVWLVARSRLTDPNAMVSTRQCALLGVGLLALTLAAALLPQPRPGRSTRRLLLATVAVALLVAIGTAAWARPDLSGSHRRDYWQVARDEYTGHPALGSGAGTFAHYWALNGPASAGEALDAHSLYLETLAELGPIGVVLVLAAFALPLARAPAVRTEPLGTVAVAAYVAFVVHAGLDWDWELAAVTLCGLACGGAVLAAGRRESPQGVELGRRRRIMAGSALAAVGLLGLTGLLSGTQPGL